MTSLNLFIVLSIIAAASLFGAVVTPAQGLSHDNKTVGLDNPPMPMGNMTMDVNNSMAIHDNSTMPNLK